MISFERVSVTYADAAAPAIRDVNLRIEEGALCLVIGCTGAGKSTLLGAVNGLVPHFTGGRLTGRVTVGGRDTRTHPPRDLADVVGVVGQDPLAGFVTDSVEEELAYGMEQLGVASDVMRKRVEETLDLIGIAELRDRPLRTLSGGQQQRVAIASVLTAGPRVLVLDEPTSALDPGAAEDVLATITRLVHDLGVTVVMAEHRLERVVQYADRLVQIDSGGTVTDGDPAGMLKRSPVAPPVVALGRWAGWHPLPLSVRDARRRAGPLRAALAAADPQPRPPTRTPVAASGFVPAVGDQRGAAEARVALRAKGIVVRYGDLVAVRDVSLVLRAGSVAAVMGRNGSGKSSLLWALQGTGSRAGGRVDIGGADPAAVPADRPRGRVALVPQTPTDLLYLDSVAAECAQADTESAAPAGTASALLARFAPGIDRDMHPRDLSEGQRLALVLAIQLAARPDVVLLDEPTRGLDYPGKAALARVLAGLAAGGSAVLVSTHDVEFVAAACDRALVLAGGEVVADGATADVVVSSPMFAPQVAKIVGSGPWLTVDGIRAALPAGPPRGGALLAGQQPGGTSFSAGPRGGTS